MKFTKLVKAEFEDKFSDEWFDGDLQSLISWAENTRQLLKDGSIKLENKRKIKYLIQDFFEQIDKASKN